jgi:hypothetical protein
MGTNLLKKAAIKASGDKKQTFIRSWVEMWRIIPIFDKIGHNSHSHIFLYVLVHVNQSPFAVLLAKEQRDFFSIGSRVQHS